MKTIFSKNWFFVLIMVLTAPFITSCSDDDEFVNTLPVPQFEEESGRYDITDSSSPYKRLELFASGQYLLVTNSSSAYPMSATRSAIASRATTSRTPNNNGMYYGRFTKVDNENFQLEGFGSVQLKNAGTEITFQPNNGTPQTAKAEKAATMANEEMTNALCRTWKVLKVRERGWNEFEGEWDDTYTHDMIDPELVVNIVFSKSGTFMNTYQDGSIYASYWRWEDMGRGIIRSSSDNVWGNDDEGNATITFSEGNKVTMYEYYKDLETGEWEEITVEAVDAMSVGQ